MAWCYYIFHHCLLPQARNFLLPCAFCEVTLAGGECCLNSVFIVKKLGWRECFRGGNIFPEGHGELASYSVVTPTQCLAHSRCNKSLLNKNKEWKRKEASLSGLKLRRWAGETGVLSPGALVARVWLPNSGFVKNYGLWEPDGPGADLSKGQILVVTELLSSLLEAPFFGNTAWQVCGESAYEVTHPHRIWISFPSPVSFPNLRWGHFPMGCAFPETPSPARPGESRPWVRVWRPHLKCQTSLCWQGPRIAMHT